jgi:hypothetical protein
MGGTMKNLDPSYPTRNTSLVRYNPYIERLEPFLASSDEVANLLARSRKLEKEKGLKEWVPCFYPAKAEFDRLKKQWDAFGKTSQQ